MPGRRHSNNDFDDAGLNFSSFLRSFDNYGWSGAAPEYRVDGDRRTRYFFGAYIILCKTACQYRYLSYLWSPARTLPVAALSPLECELGCCS